MIAWASASGSALGQSSAEDAARAEVLFRDARALVKAGKSAEACPKFAESHRLDPQVGTLLNLALCNEATGKTASAWAEFKEVTERATGSKERGGFAQKHALSLEERLSYLRVRVDPVVAGLTFKLDGRPLGSEALESRFPLDPGEHVLEATAPGWSPWTSRVRIGPGPRTADVAVNMVQESPTTTAAVSTPAAPETSPPLPPIAADAPKAHGTRTVGLVAAVVGVGAIGVGTVFGLKAFSKKAEKDSLCPADCVNPNYDLAMQASHDSKAYAIASTITMGVGLAALATGAYLVLIDVPAANHVELAPVVTHTTAGLAFHARW